MPLIVDHEQRRTQIAAVVKRIVANSGMDSVTIRNVAREAGFSSTIVSHYFRDKHDLLQYTYATISLHAVEMVEEAFREGADLLACFERLLPSNPHNLADWHAWFGFWGKANAYVDLAAERNTITIGTGELFERIIEHAQRQGELPAHLAVKFHADRLQIFINGLASFTVMQPEVWTPSVQHALLAFELELMKSIGGNAKTNSATKARRRTPTLGVESVMNSQKSQDARGVSAAKRLQTTK